MDFSRYFRDTPTPDGYYGPYGGAHLPPELQAAFASLSTPMMCLSWEPLP